MKVSRKKLFVVVGATASGKTALAIELALKYGGEIISADSRQIYKEMSIGTAVPSKEELAQVRHHLVQTISVTERFSAGDYRQEATAVLKDIFSRKDVAVVAGGTGLYINALLYGLDTFPDVTEATKNRVNIILEREGIAALLDILRDRDPLSFSQVDKNNPRRVARMVTVILESNLPYSSFLSENREDNLTQNGIVCDIERVIIDLDREVLYDRINRRVDQMMSNGLLDEVRGLVEYKNRPSLSTVGYSELFDYLDNKISLERAVELIKQNTRRYAKRQLTWIRNKI